MERLDYGSEVAVDPFQYRKEAENSGQAWYGVALSWQGFLAEAVRFELTDGFPSPVFKTGAIDHSATLPVPGF